jgi:probable F420-dependent oxidoreductase
MEIGLFHTVQWPEGSKQSDRYAQSLREAELAEELGFDSVWFTEHHFSRHGIVSDSLSMLAYLAGRTSNIRLGTAVSVLPLHNPLRLAETVATIDQLSGGRIDFGIGRGYQPSEFEGFNVDIAEKSERFDEALEILTKAWTSTESFTHDGRFWSFPSAAPQPKPVQEPHPPIWVATDSPDGLRRCVENDYGVLLPQGRGLDGVAKQMERYGTALSDAGQTLEDANVYLARTLFAAETDESAWEQAEQPYMNFVSRASKLADPSKKVSGADGPFALEGPLRDSVMFASPETLIAMLQKIRGMGIKKVMFFVHLGDLSPKQITDSMRLFAKEVLPAAREL